MALSLRRHPSLLVLPRGAHSLCRRKSLDRYHTQQKSRIHRGRFEHRVWFLASHLEATTYHSRSRVFSMYSKHVSLPSCFADSDHGLQLCCTVILASIRSDSWKTIGELTPLGSACLVGNIAPEEAASTRT
jgi:hypothetical protein